ncbi:Uncharacterised protein [uncultured archaeon]|nr:Uncharacterised protein [uncultured archaeon]
MKNSYFGFEVSIYIKYVLGNITTNFSNKDVNNCGELIIIIALYFNSKINFENPGGYWVVKGIRTTSID